MSKGGLEQAGALPRGPGPRGKHGLVFISLTAALLYILRLTSWCVRGPYDAPPDPAKVEQCAIEAFQTDLSFLDAAKPIRAAEFLDRRDRLAKALVASGADAFVLEPGYTFQYATRGTHAVIRLLTPRGICLLGTMATSPSRTGSLGSPRRGRS